MMSSVDLQSLNEFLPLLASYKSYAYPALFLGAFFETLIPFSLVVYGELFFLAGAALAGIGTLDIRVVAAVLYLGGILGDNSSYWLGRRYGLRLFTRLSSAPLASRFISAQSLDRGSEFFTNKGKYAVFLARLSGPFSWVVPALAGSFRQPYPRFLLFNTAGVILGIGEFLLLGYLFGNNLETIMAWCSRLGLLPILVCTTLAILAIKGCRAGRSGNRSHSEPG